MRKYLNSHHPNNLEAIVMLKYEISQIIHVLLPYISNTLSVISGIVISNLFWKARIHRYAKAEIIETLEYQKNKIEFLESENNRKDEIIGDQKGSLELSKIAALKIIEVTK